MKVFVQDFNRGCAANRWLSVCLREAFARSGAEAASRWSEADLVVLNSCPAMASAAGLVEGFRRRAGGAGGPAVVEAGCLVPDSGATAGPRVPLAALLEDPAAAGRVLGLTSAFEFTAWEAALESPDLSFVEIARGPRSLSAGEVEAAARKAAAKGARRLVLAADAPGGWGQDLPRPLDLADLVGRLRLALPSCRWVLPAAAAEDLERLVPRLAPHLGGFDAVGVAVTGPLPEARTRIPLLASGLKEAGLRGTLHAEFVIGWPGETFSDFLDAVFAASSFDAVVFHAFDLARHPAPAGSAGQGVSAEEFSLRARVLRSLSGRFPFRDDIPAGDGKDGEGRVKGLLVELAKASLCAEGLWTCLGPKGGQWRGGLRYTTLRE